MEFSRLRTYVNVELILTFTFLLGNWSTNSHLWGKWTSIINILFISKISINHLFMSNNFPIFVLTLMIKVKSGLGEQLMELNQRQPAFIYNKEIPNLYLMKWFVFLNLIYYICTYEESTYTFVSSPLWCGDIYDGFKSITLRTFNWTNI